MTEAWFAAVLYCSCPEPCGGEGSGVSGVAKKESRELYVMMIITLAHSIKSCLPLHYFILSMFLKDPI